MAQKILGLDLGTSSIGIAVRNPNVEGELIEQLEYFSSDIFESGVGINKSGEYSFAAERTKHRQSRRLYETRRRRLWATLGLLIEHGLCPLSKEGLYSWRTYNAQKMLFRKYPNEYLFEQWIKLDFDGDGKPDFSSPYQMRALLAEQQLDFNKQENRFILGRALYHIAQRRGFKSSKGETIVDQEKESTNEVADIDVNAEMKKSEAKVSSAILQYMQEHNVNTVGQAFAMLENAGQRIRNNAQYKAVRSLYLDEISYIFKFQDGLSTDSELYRRLVSTKKGEGTIFYKKPLKSQKGNVGKCTLETKKSRCPVSHPAFEKFRAWSLLNNIQIRETAESEWQDLSVDLKKKLYNELFVTRVKSDFKFEEIRKKLELTLFRKFKYGGKNATINYKDTISVAGCPVTARLIKLLGDGWETTVIQGIKERTSHSKHSRGTHVVSYTALDLWNVCFNCDDPEELDEFAEKRLSWDDEKKSALKRLWSSMRQGYSMLSLKAINNINAMLVFGLKYSDAVLMAKIPDIVGSEFNVKEFLQDFDQIKEQNTYDRKIISIVNALIADYKSLAFEERFAHKDTSYHLQESDYHDIERHIIDYYGVNTWSSFGKGEQDGIRSLITEKYQEFFMDYERKFYPMPRISDALKQKLSMMYPDIDSKKWSKLYHHSQITVYKPLKSGTDKSEWRLNRPNLGSIKNPMALRTLNMLRRKINAMLDAGMIDPEETRIVVETTRSLNDANMRWAIDQYQEQRKSENKAIRTLLQAEYPKREISTQDVDMTRYMLEQGENDMFLNEKNHRYGKNVQKYKLWMEQEFQCIYTGKMISLSNLFDDLAFDIEHTIPRSKSFDSSDANLTVCDAHYNRSVKRNCLPTELPNFEKTAVIDGIVYTPIKPRLEKWEARITRLKDNVDFWKAQSRRAQTKERKDQCIRQRHLWQMELDYWRAKLDRFTRTEVTEGFRNSQLVDTGIITRHAVLFLKSLFNNVEVQKGSVTADFRKMLGIQSIDEKKNRDLHSHHAIDAATLTMIPLAAKRDKMLELYYLLCEAKDRGHDYTTYQKSLEHELSTCNLGREVSSIVRFIEENILVNQHTKDQTLTPSHRRMKVRGKVVMVPGDDGNAHEIWQTGDSIRGQLHKESYFGAIMRPLVDHDGNLMIKDGKFTYDGQVTMAIRYAINDSEKFKTLEDFNMVIDSHLKEQLVAIISERLGQGMTFKEAINQDIWLRDKNGQEIHQDRNGRPLRPIRHVRCLVKAGKGYMTRKKSLEIRSQLNRSTKRLINIPNRDHKQLVYAQNETNYLFLLYEGIKKGKIERQSRIINLFELSLIVKDVLFNGSIEQYIRTHFDKMDYKKVSYSLSAIIAVGTKVIFWNEHPDEIKDLDKKELNKRLYIVTKFNNTGSNHVYLQHHLDATGVTLIDPVPNKLNCLIEHRDFEIDELGNITFIDW